MRKRKKKILTARPLPSETHIYNLKKAAVENLAMEMQAKGTCGEDPASIDGRLASPMMERLAQHSSWPCHGAVPLHLHSQ